MPYMRTAVEYSRDSARAFAHAVFRNDGHVLAFDTRRHAIASERALDEALADSFPASDPPPWTLGIARSPSVADTGQTESIDRATPRDGLGGSIKVDVIDVSLPSSDQTFAHGLLSFTGAAGVGLLVPFAILLIGLPVALAVRGAAEAASWLLTRLVG